MSVSLAACAAPVLPVDRATPANGSARLAPTGSAATRGVLSVERPSASAVASVPAPPHPPAGAATVAKVWGEGKCVPDRDRPTQAPAWKEYQACAYFRGCPPQSTAPAIGSCPADLGVLTVRELAIRVDLHRVGQRVAVRGLANRVGTLRSNGGPPPRREGRVGPPPCDAQTYMLSLASEDDETCLKTMIMPGERVRELGCNGDATDACCRKARAFPPLNTPVVAVGTYAESVDLGDGRRMDLIEVESTCLPAPTAKAIP